MAVGCSSSSRIQSIPPYRRMPAPARTISEAPTCRPKEARSAAAASPAHLQAFWGVAARDTVAARAMVVATAMLAAATCGMATGAAIRVDGTTTALLEEPTATFAINHGSKITTKMGSHRNHCNRRYQACLRTSACLRHRRCLLSHRRRLRHRLSRRSTRFNSPTKIRMR